jgi:predicted deacetylase
VSARALCVSIHDVAPATWAACRALADAIREVDAALPLTLLVVPCYHGSSATVPSWYRDWLDARLQRGDEIALHGYTHRDDAPPARSALARLARRGYTAGEGEFAAISRTEAAQRIAAGLEWCGAQGWRVSGFVAPAWLMSAGTWRALGRFDFSYTTTLGRFYALRADRDVWSPSLVYSARAAWRRYASRRWNEALRLALRTAPLVRLGVHPADAQHPALVAHIQRTLDAVRRGRVGMTKAEYAFRLGEER